MNVKLTLVATATALTLLSGCSTTKGTDPTKGTNVSAGGDINPGLQQALNEQRVVNDFKRQGIRVIFSLGGELEAIESVGYAPVRGNSQMALRESYRVAELEAKKAMNDFINRETITSSTSVAMISRNLERAKDNRVNNFATNRNNEPISEVSDEEVGELSMPGEARVTGTETNTANRDDAINIASRVKTNIAIRNSGILSGLYLVEGQVVNSGRTVRAVYRWDQRHVPVRARLRDLMAQ